MRATSLPGVRRTLKAVAVPLAAVALLMSVQGCSTKAAATISVTGPTQASALRAFNSYAAADQVALADHNELLALSLTTSAQYALVAAGYTAGTGPGAASAKDRPVYGRPTLYVPKLTTYPQWFMAVAPEHPAGGGPSRTALMVFYRADARTAWALSGSVLLDRPAPPLKVLTARGNATALATSDQSLQVRPEEVGAMNATVADDGPASAASAAVAAGPQTTGLYSANAAIARQASARHEFYQWELEGSSYPVFALRTAGGGALVFYTMYLNTTTQATNEPPRHSHAPLPTVPVPPEYQPFLPAGTGILHHELTGDQTMQFAALVPPASAKTAKIQVIGSGGGPTYAHGF